MDSAERILSLCTGYAGIELGLIRAGTNIKPVCYIENEIFNQANLVKNIEKGWLHSAPIFSCVKALDAKPFRGKIHGITGGYPCTPFSQASKRKGKEDPRHLWPYFRKHIEDSQPYWVFFENVYGHLTLGLDTVINELQRLGYQVQAGIFSADECRDRKGQRAPQKRKRLFILGCKKAFALGYSEYFRLCQASYQRTAERESEARRMQEPKRGCNQSSLEYDWIAPPAREQYSWEEPRLAPFKCELGREPTRATSGLDSVANRTSRMIALGNGVIPQMAERAWLTLWDDMATYSNETT